MPDVKKGYSLSHSYKYFKKKYGFDIDLATYRAICCAFNKKIVQNVIDGKVVKLPHSLGDLWIKKIKTNYDKPRVDLNETKKLGKTIYHLNEHSEGWWARWYWSRKCNLVTNMIYYSFQPTRENSRNVAKVMKKINGHKRYFS